MAKTVKAVVKLQIPAGNATPQPPVGPALGQHGVNIPKFCKEFNDKTRGITPEGIIIPVIVTIYDDKSFTFITKKPPASVLLKRAANIAVGAHNPGSEIVGKITKKQLREIAEMKMPDLNTNDIEKAMKIIAGSAKSMGIEIIDEEGEKQNAKA